MGRRHYIALAAMLVMLAGVAVWQGLREREPVYQGKRLSFWLESLYKAKGNQDEVDRAEQPIRNIGTNALPVLIERLHAQDSRMKQLVMKWARKQKLVHFHFTLDRVRRDEAIGGYAALGPMARGQIPRLSDTLVHNPFPGVGEPLRWC